MSSIAHSTSPSHTSQSAWRPVADGRGNLGVFNITGVRVNRARGEYDLLIEMPNPRDRIRSLWQRLTEPFRSHRSREGVEFSDSEDHQTQQTSATQSRSSQAWVIRSGPNRSPALAPLAEALRDRNQQGPRSTPRRENVREVVLTEAMISELCGPLLARMGLSAEIPISTSNHMVAMAIEKGWEDWEFGFAPGCGHPYRRKFPARDGQTSSIVTCPSCSLILAHIRSLHWIARGKRVLQQSYSMLLQAGYGDEEFLVIEALTIELLKFRQIELNQQLRRFTIRDRTKYNAVFDVVRFDVLPTPRIQGQDNERRFAFVWERDIGHPQPIESCLVPLGLGQDVSDDSSWEDISDTDNLSIQDYLDELLEARDRDSGATVRHQGATDGDTDQATESMENHAQSFNFQQTRAGEASRGGITDYMHELSRAR